jgi:hypothetical protein
MGGKFCLFALGINKKKSVNKRPEKKQQPSKVVLKL